MSKERLILMAGRCLLPATALTVRAGSSFETHLKADCELMQVGFRRWFSSIRVITLVRGVEVALFLSLVAGPVCLKSLIAFSVYKITQWRKLKRDFLPLA